MGEDESAYDWRVYLFHKARSGKYTEVRKSLPFLSVSKWYWSLFQPGS